MTHRVQSYLALLVVAAAVAGLVFRLLARKGKPGCGGDCGCAADRLKAGRGGPGQ